MEIAEEDGGLSTHHDEDDVRQHDEPKHVVHRPRPGQRGILKYSVSYIQYMYCSSYNTNYMYIVNTYM